MEGWVWLHGRRDDARLITVDHEARAWFSSTGWRWIIYARSEDGALHVTHRWGAVVTESDEDSVPAQLAAEDALAEIAQAVMAVVRPGKVP